MLEKIDPKIAKHQATNAACAIKPIIQRYLFKNPNCDFISFVNLKTEWDVKKSLQLYFCFCYQKCKDVKEPNTWTESQYFLLGQLLILMYNMQKDKESLILV